MPLRWVYTVNNGQPITASLAGITMRVLVGSTEIKLDPTNLQRQFAQQGQVSGRFENTDFTGNYSSLANDNLMISAGKTISTNQSLEVNLSISGGGESGNGKLNAKIGALTPPYEWFLDRDNLDQLTIGQVQTITSNGVADFNVTVTGEAPIVRSNQPVSLLTRQSNTSHDKYFYCIMLCVN